MKSKPCAYLLYWIVCNLHLEDLQCINAASISLVLGESGLISSQTVRSSLVKRKKEKQNTVRKWWWRLLSQYLFRNFTGFDSVAFRNSWAIPQFKRLRNLFLEKLRCFDCVLCQPSNGWAWDNSECRHCYSVSWLMNMFLSFSGNQS